LSSAYRPPGAVAARVQPPGQAGRHRQAPPGWPRARVRAARSV